MRKLFGSIALKVFMEVLAGGVDPAQATTFVNQPTNPLPDAGEKQIELLLQDRPQLQMIVQKGNKIWDWLHSAFNDTSHGMQVQWDNRPTTPNLQDSGGSQCTGPNEQHICFVTVDGTYKSGPELGLARPGEAILGNLIFELINVRHWADRKEVYEMARNGTIGKDDFTLAIAKTEFVAAQGTADFYTKVWIRFCRERHLPCEPGLWQEPMPATFDKWLSYFPRTDWYPWKCYSQSFDACRAQNNAYETAYLNIREDHLPLAIAALSTPSISASDPDPYTCLLRGVAEMAIGDMGHALIDIREADKLKSSADPSRADDHFLCWLIEMEQGKASDANRELSNYFNLRSTSPDWRTTISMFLLDRLSEADFLAAASSPDHTTNQAQRSEAWYYAGMKRLLAIDKETAKKYFHECLECHPDLRKLILAREELKALESIK